jgi:two-component system sensor histidine kinase BaeS
MRLRLVHTLSLWLLGAVGLAVAAMGLMMAWNLGRGFADFVAAREAERLEQFAVLAAQTIEKAGGVEALRERRGAMRELLEAFAVSEGRGRPAPQADGPGAPPGFGFPPPPPRFSEGPGPDRRAGPPPGPPLGPPGRPDGGGGPPPPRGDPGAFGERVSLVRPDGSPLMGRPLQPGPYVERAIVVQGQTVAVARMVPLPKTLNDVDALFLRRQYQGIALVAGSLVLLALFGAWWLARRWARPLLAVQEATARIARGELSVRLAAGGSDEIGDVVRNVNTMAEGLQRLEGARRRWIAEISHELRTPLAVLRGEVEALLDGVRPLNERALLSLREEVLRLSGLVGDLHLLAMSDLHALPCHFTATDAAQLVRNVAQRFEPRARAQGLALSHDVPASTVWPVRWDESRIEQLLSNLLENSLRYTDAPGRMALQVQGRGEALRISLDDSAPGVPAADLPRLFEPLYRADAARSRVRGGSGLGLAICEAIAKAHGGRIGATASPLGGLRVELDLPCVAVQA